MYWFRNQEFCIKWEGLFSDGFNVTNGVRQGGILSPAFFNLYMNDLSVALSNTTVGCQVNGTLVNHLFYADDSVLLAPSPFALQTLLNVCSEFASNVDLLYNTKKTHCICVKPRMYKRLHIPYIYLNGIKLNFKSAHKYLGFILSENLRDDDDMLRVKKGMYMQGNKLIKQFHHCTDEVKVKLFKTYFNSFYGVTLWSVYKNESKNNIVTAYKRIYRKLFNITEQIGTTVKMVKMNIDPYDVIERKLILGLLTRIGCSENVIVNAIFESEYFISSDLYQCWSKKLFR